MKEGYYRIPVDHIRASFSSAIKLLPEIEEAHTDSPGSEHAAALTPEGLVHVNNALREQGLLDEDVSIGHIKIAPIAYFPSYSDTKTGEVFLYFHTETPELSGVSPDILQNAGRGPVFLVQVRGENKSVANLSSFPRFPDEVAVSKDTRRAIEARHNKIVKRFEELEPTDPKFVVVLEAVHAALVEGKAVKGKHRAVSRDIV